MSLQHHASTIWIQVFRDIAIALDDNDHDKQCNDDGCSNDAAVDDAQGCSDMR